MRRAKNKRLVYTRRPLQLTDLGSEVQGELEMGIAELVQPYMRAKFPADTLGLVLQEAVRAWRKEQVK